MKPLLIFGASFVAISFILYLVAAFASWNFNPGNWSEEARGLVAFLTLGFSAAAVPALLEYEA